MVENDEPGRRDPDSRENAPAITSRSRLWRTALVVGGAAVLLLWSAFLLWLIIKMVGWIAALV
jgi:hypothetical protein